MAGWLTGGHEEEGDVVEHGPVHLRFVFAFPCWSLTGDDVRRDESDEDDECHDLRENTLAFGSSREWSFMACSTSYCPWISNFEHKLLGDGWIDHTS